jgi:hypothetical protein
MALVKANRRPNSQPGFMTNESVQKGRAINENMRYCQGFRVAVNNGTSTTNFSLNSAGKFLLGISMLPISSTALNDTAITFSVNNNNLLLNFAAPNLNPNFVQNMIFFPLPQQLQGNDSMTMQMNKSDATDIFAYVNIFYIPMLS